MNTSVEALAKLMNFHLDKFGTLGSLIELSGSEAGRRLVDRILVAARLQADVVARNKCECAACVDMRANTAQARANTCTHPRNPKDKGALEAAHATAHADRRSTH
jgi:hypothetical protein